MNMFYENFEEFHTAVKEKAREESEYTTINWDIVENDQMNPIFLKTLDYAQEKLHEIIDDCKEFFTLSEDEEESGDIDELTKAHTLYMLREELLSAYILLDLKQKYDSIKSVTSS